MADAASNNHDQLMVSNPASPGSSPELFDDDDDDLNPAQSAQWNRQTSPSASQPQPQRSAAPLQKRRRVTRACDECRRKKIKCDGKQPCTHCTVYSYDCTYDQPSNRRRNPAPQYIENLEIRLQRAEGLIRTYLPAIDLSDPSKDAAFQPQNVPVKYPAQNAPGLAAKPLSDGEGELRSMIESTGQLDLDEDGQWDFHGGSSGTVFINRMRQQFGGLLGNDKGNLFLPKLPRPYPGSVAVFDSPKSTADSPFESGISSTADLPSKEIARALIEDSLERGCSLMRFVHKPSFLELFDRIYEIPPESYGNEENRFIPLFYMVLALGCMFYTNPNDNPNEPVHTYKAGIDQGLKYFRAARSMMDITDCRDLVSLQSVVFMILFLQSTANLSTCYSYIGIALRSSLRMGLHRNLAFNFSPIERETRRRVFWVVRKMDIYVSALLGFPHMLSSEDIDQKFPLEIDDEYITKDGILPMPPGKISYYAAANAHSRLLMILTKVIKHIYPVKGVEQALQGSSSNCYVISHAKIKDIEGDLVQWFEQLPMALRPDADSDENIVRAQQLLRLAYAHVQMMLYRPFLHYVSTTSNQSKVADTRSYACAAACVSVSRNIVHITYEMKKRGLLIGAYWFTMYTTFFAIVSLVYYVLENPKDPGSQQILADANAGKDALKSFSHRSQAADRCTVALVGLFEKLPERLKNDASVPVGPRKKRAAPSISSPAPIKSAPGPRQQQEPSMGISRATTFPLQQPTPNIPTSQPSRSSLDGPRFQTPTASNPNLRQSFSEYISPDVSAVGTPDSSRSNQPLQAQHYPQAQQFGIGNALPDLSAMMFPSEDPFAYPNQAMMEFDNFKREPMEMMSGSPAAGQMYMQSNNPQAYYDDLEGQLFGPLPPYLAQGQPYFGMQGQMTGMNNMMNSMGTPQMTFHTGMTPNMEGIFNGEGEVWSNMVPNQRSKQ